MMSDFPARPRIRPCGWRLVDLLYVYGVLDVLPLTWRFVHRRGSGMFDRQVPANAAR